MRAHYGERQKHCKRLKGEKHGTLKSVYRLPSVSYIAPGSAPRDYRVYSDHAQNFLIVLLTIHRHRITHRSAELGEALCSIPMSFAETIYDVPTERSHNDNP